MYLDYLCRYMYPSCIPHVSAAQLRTSLEHTSEIRVGYMREVRILACVSRTCMYLACIRLWVGALAIEVLATALARVHAFDPLEELALLAAVEAASGEVAWASWSSSRLLAC
jgi:hypothetical protein